MNDVKIFTNDDCEDTDGGEEGKQLLSLLRKLPELGLDWGDNDDTMYYRTLGSSPHIRMAAHFNHETIVEDITKIKEEMDKLIKDFSNLEFTPFNGVRSYGYIVRVKGK